MSGVKPSSGPERPQETVEQPPPLYKEGGFHNTRFTKIIVIVVASVIGLMLALAIAFCIVGGVQNRQPRYFLLMINLILSTVITGLLIFWYFRGTLVSSMLWYIFVQCVFLFFQCITTDVFAWYETKTANTVPGWTPIQPGINCSNGSNSSKGSNSTCNGTNATLVHLLTLNRSAGV